MDMLGDEIRKRSFHSTHHRKTLLLPKKSEEEKEEEEEFKVKAAFRKSKTGMAGKFVVPPPQALD
eukprot:CAMPEP_0170490346 /NCGR_PEP_ID=MMETSP0208-20121228/8548_1 /TAXON_ID=197538 /ORGANISM="Strombidium inclinatum, Strain S3" /LENGTH=64 /DNA_ID=CAMNT_0010765669 /DNA_START=305 /DNA_END=499 /DNA_ORIENTATION=+